MAIAKRNKEENKTKKKKQKKNFTLPLYSKA